MPRVRWYAIGTSTTLESNKSQDTMRAQFALWAALRHREVRQEKCLELWCRELDRNRRRYRLWGRCAHQARAS